MGRAKVIIRRLEDKVMRQKTFSKRKPGLFKMARDLATLCDVELVLLVFSPAGTPTIFVAEKSNLTSIMEKLARMSFSERYYRESEILKILRNMFKNEDHKFDINMCNWNLDHRLEGLKRELIELQEQRVLRNNKLTAWICPESASLEQIKAMEESLVESLEQLALHEDILKEQQLHKPPPASQASENAAYPCIPVEELSGNHVLDFFPERNWEDFMEIAEQTENLINITGQVYENEGEVAALGYQPWDDNLWNAPF